jgi:hypothetical protein
MSYCVRDMTRIRCNDTSDRAPPTPHIASDVISIHTAFCPKTIDRTNKHLRLVARVLYSNLQARISTVLTMTSNLLESNTSLTYTQPSSQPHLTHTALHKPGPNEILVRIKAAAINPVDIQLWGNPFIGWLAGEKDKGIGRDYSGEIVAAGEEVGKSQWKMGDEVFGLCNRPVRIELSSHELSTKT